MRFTLSAMAAAVALVLVPSTADACSARGQFCGYPAWAANAFEHPMNRVNLNAGPILPGVGPYGYGRGGGHYAPRYGYAPKRYRRARR